MGDFAAKLRFDRELAGLSVRQLADDTGISFSYITKIETGRAGKGISPDIVAKLATRLGADVLEYLHLSDVVPAPLKELLASEPSRAFLRSVLGTPLNTSDWSRLRIAVAETQASYSVSQPKKPNGKNVSKAAG